MNFFLALFLAGVILSIIYAFVLIVTWAVLTFVYLPLTSTDSVNLTVLYAIAEYVRQLFRFFPLLFQSTVSAIVQLGSAVYRNLFVFLIFALVAGAFFIELEYHDKIIAKWLEFRQCGIRPFVDGLVFPILNLVRIIYNLVIPIVNFWASVGGLPIIWCSRHSL